MKDRTISLPQFLTAAQIAEAVRLFETQTRGSNSVVEQILERVIEPNMAAINAKLGQENDPRYLAYAVVYVLSQSRNDHS